MSIMVVNIAILTKGMHHYSWLNDIRNTNVAEHNGYWGALEDQQTAIVNFTVNRTLQHKDMKSVIRLIKKRVKKH